MPKSGRDLLNKWKLGGITPIVMHVPNRPSSSHFWNSVCFIKKQLQKRRFPCKVSVLDKNNCTTTNIYFTLLNRLPIMHRTLL
jgi:hypothetical protein